MTSGRSGGRGEGGGVRSGSLPRRPPPRRPLPALPPRLPSAARRRHGPAPAAPPGRGQLRRGAKMGEGEAGPERQPEQSGRPARARPRRRGDARARRRALSAFVCRPRRPPHHWPRGPAPRLWSRP
ncbi:uncharacterized protein [Phocoena phocoena]|uniref:uncharacterized protein n=1 Tax=Phocoena phocoena TaxID=9742 RepID=UPI0033072AB0